jgi:hypothetical protein
MPATPALWYPGADAPAPNSLHDLTAVTLVDEEFDIEECQRPLRLLPSGMHVSELATVPPASEDKRAGSNGSGRACGGPGCVFRGRRDLSGTELQLDPLRRARLPQRQAATSRAPPWVINI